MEQRFDKPVHVMLQIGKTYVIERPVRAAEALLNQWPTQGGAKHLAARKAVLKCLENAHDQMLAAKARKAFEDAAKEANIFMSHDRPTPEKRSGAKPVRWRRKTKLKRDI